MGMLGRGERGAPIVCRRVSVARRAKERKRSRAYIQQGEYEEACYNFMVILLKEPGEKIIGKCLFLSLVRHRVTFECFFNIFVLMLRSLHTVQTQASV